MKYDDGIVLSLKFFPENDFHDSFNPIIRARAGPRM